MTRLRTSHVVGDRARPLLDLSVGALLDRAAAEWGAKEALVVRHQNIRWTYKELKERADALAAALLALGLRPGDRIGIWSPNNAEWVLAQFATAKAGLILVNINPAYRLSELEFALNKVECAALITAARFKSSDYAGMIRTLAPEIDRFPPGRLTAERLPHLRMLISLGEGDEPGFYRFDDLMAQGAKADGAALTTLEARIGPDDPVNIQFTSGTTGTPKGATLTHRNIVNNGLFCGEGMSLGPGDRLCIPVPLYHCFGMVLGNLACVAHGAAMVYPAESFDAGAVLETVAREKCTGLHGVPTMFIDMLGHPEFDRFDLSSLRTGIMAGSPCPEKVMRQVIDRMHMAEVTIAYGMTETSPVSFQTRKDDPLEKRVATVGRIHPHVEVRIIDEGGRTVPVDQPGELLTRGYSVMAGYWNDEERTAESIDGDGWMHTGDLATLDADGYCRIVGRLKDMVIRGGENIYPREVEEFLHRHPDVQDVQIFGVPDPKYGEELCAWIKLRPGAEADEDSIRGYCRGRIAHYKIPRYVRFVSDYPMTVTGKVQKFAMRDEMIEGLGLDSGGKKD